MTLDPNAARAIAQEAAATEDYLRNPVPDHLAEKLRPAFSEFVNISFKVRGILAQNLPDGAGIDEILETSWQAAREAGALRCYEGKVIFPLCAMRSDGKTPIEASIREGDPERSGGKPWFLSYVDTYVNPRAAQSLAPSKAIEQFAWLGPWDEFLSQLAAIALPEPWDFGGSDRHGHRLAILKSYICTTFYRLGIEEKVRISDDRTFAAFNTGLVDSRFDDIYACFEPGYGTLEWVFAGFAASGNRALKKRVAAHFDPLPQPAQYFEKMEDLLFDPSRCLNVDYEHILIEHIERLPLRFLEDELRTSEEASAVLQGIRASDADARKELLDQLADIVNTDSRLFRQLRRRLEDAVDIAQRRIRWNFKTAIPSYYPRADTMSLLLPLCLMDDVHADVALVVQLLPSGAYQGQTVLDMRQAYTNARLICRPDSDWLNALQAQACEEGSED